MTGFEPMALEEIQASVGMGEGSIKGTIIISFHSCTCILAKRGLGTAQNDTYDLARKLRKMLNKYGRKLSMLPVIRKIGCGLWLLAEYRRLRV